MKVLLAEDDRMTREGLLSVLLDEGFDAVAAADGDEAVKLFEQHQPEFVCLDVMMPGRSGYDVCKQIRVLDSAVPIIFITAKGEEIDKVVGLEIGGDDYIVKPFGVKEVVARIRAVARRCLGERPKEGNAKQADESFEFGDLQVMPSELRVRRGELTIDVSLREMKILQLLHEKRGTVVDRNTLMNHAWSQNYFPSSRTLDQHISQLRKRIELDAKNPQLIQTVHGVGYRYDT